MPIFSFGYTFCCSRSRPPAAARPETLQPDKEGIEDQEGMMISSFWYTFSCSRMAAHLETLQTYVLWYIKQAALAWMHCQHREQNLTACVTAYSICTAHLRWVIVAHAASPTAAVFVMVPAASGRKAVRATFLSSSASHRSFTCGNRAHN